MARKAFGITDGKGFHITFASGYGLSVQFGPGNYADNYDMTIGRGGSRDAGERGSNKAEIAITKPEGGLLDLPNGDSVDGYVTPDKVLIYMNAAATDNPLAYLAKHLPQDAA